MRIVKRGLVALEVIMAVSAAGVFAQSEEAPRAPAVRDRGPAVEAIMSMRERLQLSDDQLAALDEIRREQVERRSEGRAEMAEMRSRLRAGQIRPSEMMAFREERRDALAERAGTVRERIDAVLDDEQRETLDRIRAERRAFERGRRSAQLEREFRRGERGPRARRAPRGDRGMRPGLRGRERRAPGAGERGLRRGRGPGAEAPAASSAPPEGPPPAEPAPDGPPPIGSEPAEPPPGS